MHDDGCVAGEGKGGYGVWMRGAGTLGTVDDYGDGRVLSWPRHVVSRVAGGVIEYGG